MNLKRRFSIAHYDRWLQPSLYYEAIKNSSQEFKDEIYDIYFGKIFRHRYFEKEIWNDCSKNHDVSYGNVMGVESSDEQIDNLFKIQEEFGISVSLTINQLNIPLEIFYSKNDRVLNAFLDRLQVYYDIGLRSCALAKNHLMRSGILQNKFPDMKWKNSVNQQVATAQQVLDYLYLGYNVIQLDRSLNRNIDELKRIKDAVENYKNKHPDKYVKTSLLVWEGCMPSCPFKREHDDLQIYSNKINYWKNLGLLTCTRFKKAGEVILPRFGTNVYWSDADTFKEYIELVDIFKYSGRLTTFIPQNIDNFKIGWLFKNSHAAVASFSEIVENRLSPFSLWVVGPGAFRYLATNIEDIKKDIRKNPEYHFWTGDEGKRLERRLKNCKNQCYKCHLCERSFKVPDIDSAMEY
jgi:hypothetical protein